MPNIIITKGTYDRFGALRPVFKHLLDAFIAENGSVAKKNGSSHLV